MVQINKQNTNENCLNDEVEYKIYSQGGDTIDLSLCKDLKVEIEYKIINNDIIDYNKLIDFSNKGVDILNIKDKFFNDICFPYADEDTDSDMIIKDRVNDIYMNYSLCEKGCEYELFDIEKDAIKCICEIKQEVSPIISNGNFMSYIKSNFLASNYGIVKCYDIVFGTEGKLNNIGFWIFIIIIISHIPIYIYFFINKINIIKYYIENQMEKKGYKVEEENQKEMNEEDEKLSTIDNLKKRKILIKNITKSDTDNINSNPPKKIVESDSNNKCGQINRIIGGENDENKIYAFSKINVDNEKNMNKREINKINKTKMKK